MKKKGKLFVGLAILLTIFLPLLFFHRLFFTPDIPFFRDFYYYCYPHIIFWREAVLQGEIPFWNPTILGGLPFSSDPMTATFYPFQGFFLLWNFPWALKVFFLFHFAIALGGSYYWARQHSISIQGAVVTSLTFSFSGYLISMTSYFTKFRGLVWIPLFLGLWEASLRTSSRWTKLAGSAVLALLILSGHLYAVLFCLFFLGLDFFFFQNQKFIHKLTKVAPILLVAFFLSAIQWVPTLFLLGDSVRHTPLSHQEAQRWSMAPRRMFELAVPGIWGVAKWHYRTEKDRKRGGYWAHSIYFGVISILLAMAYFIRGKKKKKYFFMIMAGLSLLLALGSYTHLFKAMAMVIPFWGQFRYPEKFVFWITLAFSLVAGMGYDLYFKNPTTLFRGGFAFLLGLVIPMIFFPHLPQEGIAISSFSQPALGRFFLLAFLLVPLFLYRSRWILAGPLLIGLLLGDLYLVNGGEIPLTGPKNYSVKPQSLKDLPPPSLKGYRIMRLPSRDSFTPLLCSEKNLGEKMLQGGRETAYVDVPAMVYGYPSIHGMSPARLWRFHKLWNTLSKKNREIPLLVFGVRYIMGPLGTPPVKGLKLYKSYPPFQSAWYLNSRAFPRAKLYSQVEFLPSYREVEKRILQIDLAQTVLLEGAGDSIKDKKPSLGKIAFTDYTLNGVKLQVNTNTPAVLVLFDSYQKGWTVLVDGKQATLYPANIAFRGVLIDPGKHRVEFQYMPRGLKAGLSLTLFGFVALVLWLVGNFTLWKKPTPSLGQ